MPTVEKVVQELVAPIRGAVEDIRSSMQEVVDRTALVQVVQDTSKSNPMPDELVSQIESSLVDRIEGRFVTLLSEIEKLRSEPQPVVEPKVIVEQVQDPSCFIRCTSLNCD